MCDCIPAYEEQKTLILLGYRKLPFLVLILTSTPPCTYI